MRPANLQTGQARRHTHKTNRQERRRDKETEQQTGRPADRAGEEAGTPHRQLDPADRQKGRKTADDTSQHTDPLTSRPASKPTRKINTLRIKRGDPRA